jgi:hypothetical protein
LVEVYLSASIIDVNAYKITFGVVVEHDAFRYLSAIGLDFSDRSIYRESVSA